MRSDRSTNDANISGLDNFFSHNSIKLRADDKDGAFGGECSTLHDLVKKQECEINMLKERLETEGLTDRSGHFGGAQAELNHAEIIEELEDRLAQQEEIWQEKVEQQ